MTNCVFVYWLHIVWIDQILVCFIAYFSWGMGGMGMGPPRRTIPKTEARLFRIPKAEARLNGSKTRGVPFCFWLLIIILEIV